MRLRIFRVCEEVAAFGWREDIDASADVVAQAVEAACGGFSQVGLDLGKPITAFKQ